LKQGLTSGNKWFSSAFGGGHADGWTDTLRLALNRHQTPRNSGGTPGWLADDDASAAVEFALVLPIFTLILIGILKVGVALWQLIAVTNGVEAAAHQFALERYGSTPATDTVNAFFNGSSLSSSGLVNDGSTLNGYNIAASIYDVAYCTSDSSCQSLLSTSEGSNASGAPFGTSTSTQQEAQVTVKYTCDLTVLGVDFYKLVTGNSCTILRTALQRVE
jgi:Flp pilus assembly protein TadG